jgi:hypothetical protein
LGHGPANHPFEIEKTIKILPDRSGLPGMLQLIEFFLVKSFYTAGPDR